MLTAEKLQKKKEGKALRRKKVRKMKSKLFHILGSYMGHQYYRQWRDNYFRHREQRFLRRSKHQGGKVNDSSPQV